MLGDRLTSLDVNPIIVGPRGRGALVVDLLVSCATPVVRGERG